MSDNTDRLIIEIMALVQEPSPGVLIRLNPNLLE